TATLLQDGRVLIAGGRTTGGGDSALLAAVEIYDPQTRSFSPTGSLAYRRAGHTATLLPDGRVLIVGGTGAEDTSGVAETYDPQTGSFSLAGNDGYPGRVGHTATLIGRGQRFTEAFEWAIVIIGGVDRFGNYEMFPNSVTPVSQAWHDGEFVRCDGPSI